MGTRKFNILKSYAWILIKLGGYVACDTDTIWLYFGESTFKYKYMAILQNFNVK